MTDVEIRSFDEMPRSKRSGEYNEILEKVLAKLEDSPVKIVGVRFSSRSRAIGFYNWVRKKVADEHMSLELAMRTIDNYTWVLFTVPPER